jgi:hypothetical protein
MQHMCKLVYLRMTLRDKYKLHSKALLKNVSDSFWYTLYANGDDSDFVAATSLTRASFEILIGAFKLFYIFKSGPQNKKGGRCARVKDHHCVLGLLLHVYRSSGERMIFTEMFGISPTTLDRTLLKGEEALLKALDYLPEAVIEWPSHELQVELARKAQRKEPLIMGRWRFADGKNYPVQTPSNSNIQNGLSNGWLKAALITGVILYDADGCIIWAKLNYFGSWNDGETSIGMREKLADGRKNVDGHEILTDSAFPCSGKMFGRIMTPEKEGESESAPRSIRKVLLALWGAIKSMRQSAEWGMGAVSKEYRCLNKRLDTNPIVRGRLLLVTHKLYNYRVRTTGISQIRKYFNI